MEVVAKLSKDFLHEEIFSVIEGRGLSTLEQYLDAARPGRKVALTKVQREAVWRVREALMTAVAASKATTLEGWRRRAEERVRAGDVGPRYDAVVIDEAQDLSPTVIAALVGLCKTPGGIFLAADANQSIYGAGFRWGDVHEWLKFKGRTGVLRANFRSTREIGEAANAYLAQGVRTSARYARRTRNSVESQYVHSGAIPAVRAVEKASDETKLLARFFKQATRSLRLGLGACAVLVPTNDAAARIVSELSGAGVAAKKVDANDLELTRSGCEGAHAEEREGPRVPDRGARWLRRPHVPGAATRDGGGAGGDRRARATHDVRRHDPRDAGAAGRRPPRTPYLAASRGADSAGLERRSRSGGLMETVRLPERIADTKQCAEYNRRVADGSLRLEWTEVRSCDPASLTALLAGITLEALPDGLNVDSMPEAVSDEVQARARRERCSAAKSRRRRSTYRRSPRGRRRARPVRPAVWRSPSDGPPSTLSPSDPPSLDAPLGRPFLRCSQRTSRRPPSCAETWRPASSRSSSVRSRGRPKRSTTRGFARAIATSSGCSLRGDCA